MRGDIAILIISVFIIGLFVIIKRKKNIPWSIQVISAVLFVGLLVTTLLPSLPLIISPLTPSLQGRVIDAETGKPLSNINIKIGWEILNAGPGGGGRSVYKTYTTTTNDTGEFKAPSILMPFTVFLISGLREYGGINIIAYSYDYEFSRSGVNRDEKKSRFIEIQMQPIKDEKSYWESILNIYWEGITNLGSRGENVSAEERRFLKDAYSYFKRRFPNANYAELKDKAYFGQFAVTLDDLKEPVEAIKINQLIIEKYPSSASAELAAEDIKRLKEKYNLKIEDNSKGEGK